MSDGDLSKIENVYAQPEEEMPRLRIYAPRSGPYFVTHVWGPMQMETMQLIDKKLNCEDNDYGFLFGDLPEDTQSIECVMRWDRYDDASFPVLENVKVVETFTPYEMEIHEKVVDMLSENIDVSDIFG